MCTTGVRLLEDVFSPLCPGGLQFTDSSTSTVSSWLQPSNARFSMISRAGRLEMLSRDSQPQNALLSMIPRAGRSEMWIIELQLLNALCPMTAKDGRLERLVRDAQL